MVRFHFLQYASQNLLYHATNCGSLDIDFLSKFDSFFQYGSHYFESFKDLLFTKMNIIIPDGFYPLNMAAQAGLTAYAVHLLHKGEDPDLANSHGRSAITYATMHGHAETVAALLNHNASFAINDWDGLTPTHHAAKGYRVKVLRYLLDSGADPMSPKSTEYNNIYGSRFSTSGKTPMEYACEAGNAGVVSEMLQKQGSQWKSTVLPHCACATSQIEVLLILLQEPETRANINKKDRCGNTALFLAARIVPSCAD